MKTLLGENYSNVEWKDASYHLWTWKDHAKRLVYMLLAASAPLVVVCIIKLVNGL